MPWDRLVNPKNETNDKITQTLERLYPRDRYPVHIRVAAIQGANYSRVRVTDDEGIDFHQDVYPEDYLVFADDKKDTAFLTAVEKIMTHLIKSGKLSPS